MKTFKQFLTEETYWALTDTNDVVVKSGFLSHTPNTLSDPFPKEVNDFTANGFAIELKDLPEVIMGDLTLRRAKLTSLVGLPGIGGAIDLGGNQLTSLEGSPSVVNGDFSCQGNKLTNLKGAPEKVYGNFNCVENFKLASLEGAPKKILGDFDCYSTDLTSLKDIHKHIEMIDGEANFNNNEIDREVLGVLLIKNLQSISLDAQKVEKIINKYLPNTRGMEAVFECQEELIEAGFEEYAQL